MLKKEKQPGIVMSLQLLIKAVSREKYDQTITCYREVNYCYGVFIGPRGVEWGIVASILGLETWKYSLLLYIVFRAEHFAITEL